MELTDSSKLLTRCRANENELYFDTEPSPFCAVGRTSELLLLSHFTDGESSAASLFEQGSAEIGLILARLMPLPTTPRSVTVLPVLPDVAAVDIVGESKPLFTPPICEEVKDAALGATALPAFCINPAFAAMLFIISSISELGVAIACSRSSSFFSRSGNIPVTTSSSSSIDNFFESPSAVDALSPLSANKVAFAFFRLSKRDLHNETAFAQYGIASAILDANS
uniref:Uncharacterized protein n=1 Tax=Aegilops tauschii subsp. strangulata TaxID=200361 RepID=A0A453BP40_AEGTS